MAGFPLTAWALRHPWGDDADAVFDRMRDSSPPVAVEPMPTLERLGELLDALEPDHRRACSRWGASRVAMVVGIADARPSADALAATQTMAARRTAIGGAVYHRLDPSGGIAVMASAHRLLRTSLADAVLVVGLGDGRGSILLLERHGNAFVELYASAEATGTTTEATLDESAVTEVVGSAWERAGRASLGAVLAQTSDADPRAEAERRALHEALGPVTCCSMPGGSGVTDVVLVATSLARGFTPGPQAHELEHDRFMLHASSSTGQHAALLLGARA